MPAKCPKGKILRVEYTRKSYTRADGTFVQGSTVKAGCVPDKGKPGKTPLSRKILPKPTPGSLSKFGYHDVKHTLAAQRHGALTKAVQDAGYATIVRRVNLIANYNKFSDPTTHKIMRGDIAWMQKNLAPKFSKTFQRKKSSKNLVKVGTKVVAGRSRQLYHLSGSTSQFYRYKKRDGSFGRRYV
jgi:hypothetical protein